MGWIGAGVGGVNDYLSSSLVLRRPPAVYAPAHVTRNQYYTPQHATICCLLEDADLFNRHARLVKQTEISQYVSRIDEVLLV